MSTGAPSRPNVIVIMADQLKATASQLYGGPDGTTPSLARLAARGIRFEHAYTPHPLCVPARVSLWSGLYPHGHGSRRNELLMRPGVDHPWRVWRDAGYRTALIGKNHCFAPDEQQRWFDVACELGHVGRAGCPPPRGMDWPRPGAGIDAAHAVRRDMPPVSPRFSYAISDAPEEDFSSSLVAEQASRFIAEHRDEPFAMWVSFPDPHEPYAVPRRYAEMFDPDAVELPPQRSAGAEGGRVNGVLEGMLRTDEDSDADVRAAVAAYYASTRFVDDGIGTVLATLEQAGLSERTIVVFCADHGEFAGEHGMFSKGAGFFDCLVRVPLVIAWPGTLPAGEVEPGLVSLVDVVPSLLHLQGLPPLRHSHSRGLPGLVPGVASPDAAFAEYGAGGPPVGPGDIAALAPRTGYQALLASLWPREAEGRRKMVRTREWKYVHDPDGDLELYDLAADPHELINVAADPAHRGVIDNLRTRLLDWMINTEDGHHVPLPEGPDPRFFT